MATATSSENTVQKPQLDRPGKPTSPPRSVFLGRWRRSGKGIWSFWSFHEVILVADHATDNITPDTQGVVVDWGKSVDGQVVTQNAPARLKRFNFEFEQKMGNAYRYRGETHWTNEQIKQLVEIIGRSYTLLQNNCQAIVQDTIQAITRFQTLGNEDNEFVTAVAQALLRDREAIDQYLRKHTFITGASMDTNDAAWDITAELLREGVWPLELEVLDRTAQHVRFGYDFWDGEPPCSVM